METDPEPDIAVVPGEEEDYLAAHPTTALLVLEVGDSTLAFDLADKMSLYAAAGIADYWVLDVSGRRLVVHRDPMPDAEQRFGHRYRAVTEYAAGQSAAPLAAPFSPITIDDLLPRLPT